jgi:hypothetical protein
VVKKRTISRFLIGGMVLTLAALACTAPGAQQPDTAATVAAVYATITQQANLPPLTLTALAATTHPLPATPTQLVPVTPTPPDSRGALTVIHACPNAITIDAKENDWPDSVTTLNVDQVVYDPNKEWTGPADLGGTVKLCWTDSSLFVLVNVTDDVHFQTQSGENSYKGDEVELMFDADLRGDFYSATWDGDDTQLSLNPGDFGTLVPAAYRYRPPGGSPGNIRMDARAIGKTANYKVEAEIAWGELGSTRPANARNFGLCVAVSDADHPEKAPAEDTLVSHCAGLKVSDPTTWGSVTFVAP